MNNLILNLLPLPPTGKINSTASPDFVFEADNNELRLKLAAVTTVKANSIA
jgi:hypothetical protein